MSVKVKRRKRKYLAAFLTALCLTCQVALSFAAEVGASEDSASRDSEASEYYDGYGGGYAVTGQLGDVGYQATLYDATNGLPTSEAMFLLSASDGYMWIGGYSEVRCYDGSVFEKLDSSGGLTSARGFFEDSTGRIWVGTNDNGVVVVDGTSSTHFTYKEGLPSSSIRTFAEDASGNIFIGTTDGICYVDTNMNLVNLSDKSLDDARILRLDADNSGRIYGHTTSGIVFSIDDCDVSELYESTSLGMEKATTIMADTESDGKVYIGTEGGRIYHGDFGAAANEMDEILETGLDTIHFLSYDCGRLWASSTSEAGYFDEHSTFHVLSDIPLNGGIEMHTSDYQGNMWFASSTQGVMKLVTSNFVDVNKEMQLPESVTNAVYLDGDTMYIGTETGLTVISKDGKRKAEELTDFIGETRIRCMIGDTAGNLWIATYTNDKGLICVSEDGDITSYTTENGMPDNKVRCVILSSSGSILAGTNGGLAEIKNGKVVRTVGAEEGISNTVFLTLAEAEDGKVYAGSDGGGLYVIDGSDVSEIGRDDGLTSDVIMRIVEDEERGVYWLVTSNSIQYMKNGKITQVSSFPSNDNYDIYFDDSGNAWILSPYGLFCINADELFADNMSNYRLYSIENGLPFALTTNAYSAKDKEGNLYMAGREGVIKVNINGYYEQTEMVKTAVGSIICDDKEILPDEDGIYRLPKTAKRIQIQSSVLDYTTLNPMVHVFLDGTGDDGITVLRSSLTPLEFTNLSYGTYTIHIQLLDSGSGSVLSDDTFTIVKSARVTELPIFRILIIVCLVLAAGFVVWRFLSVTVIRRQYDEIREARDEAIRSNEAKTRFLANISHEIRTPINAIIGMNEMVMRENAAGVPSGYFMSIRNYAFGIRNASESLLSLINDLLDMSKIESGKMHLVEQEYDVQETLRSVVSMIRQRSTEKGLVFDVVIDEVMPRRLYGDAGKIKQILLNLLTNAVKYTDMGGFSLCVSMNERHNETAFIRFSVKDTGMGIKEEDMERLFAAYERLDEKRNSGIQGTGMGLDISRRFVGLMNGKLWCESTYGEGSEFILTLSQKIIDETPLGLFVEHDEKVNRPYVPKFIAPDADILVVDDTPMNLNVIKGLLKATRVFVTTSTSGEDALDKIRDNHFDVVLLDHIMPGMDGLETVAEIRKFAPDLPVYAFSANAAVGEDFYKAHGFNGYLPKPVDSELLEKTIMKHLPKEIMEKPTEKDTVQELTEMPQDMHWIYETEGLSVSEGIKNSGGITNYIVSLNLFLDTIDDNARVIRDACDSGNIRLFTIKVHAVKSSARIIGAAHLSERAQRLENAGNNNDMDYISGDMKGFMAEYEAYKEKLARLKSSKE